MRNIEQFFFHLGRASMCSEDSSYNGITELESSESYKRMLEDLYINAISELYGFSDVQRGIAISRINEVRTSQEYFDIPTQETVDSLLHDFYAQPEGKRNKSLLEDYHYCKFVLECVAFQKEYLDKFSRLLTVKSSEEKTQENIKKLTDNNLNTSEVWEKDTEWLTVDEVVSKFKLSKNNIKDRQWRIKKDFPYKGFDEKKGAYMKVTFNAKDVENWIYDYK